MKPDPLEKVIVFIAGLAFLLFTDLAYAVVAARVDFASGNAVITNTVGVSRAAAKGVEASSGETIETNQGRVQIKFTDGGMVALQPNTTFKIVEYNYAGAQDGTERNFASLIKGGLRIITGLVGKKNRESYKLTTPVATIGIRGTEFLAKYDSALEVRCVEGGVYVTNPSGSIDLSRGQSARVESEAKPPQQTDIPPQMDVRTPAKTFEFVVSDERTASGSQDILQLGITGNAAPLPEGPIYNFRLSAGLRSPASGLFTGNSVEGYPVSVVNDAVGLKLACINGGACDFSSALTSGGISVYHASNPTYSISSTTAPADTLDPSTVRSFATFDNGAIGIGSWVGGTVWGAGWENAPLGGLHYVIGLPVSPMPTSGAASYSMVAATAPTFSNGSTVLGRGLMTSASMLVDFGLNTLSGNLGLSFTGGSYQTSFSGSVSGSTILASGTTIKTSGSIDVCGAGCSSTVQGIFAGLAAKDAGLVYLIQTNQIFVINGAAVLQKP